MEFDQLTMLLLWQGDRAGEYDDEVLGELQDAQAQRFRTEIITWMVPSGAVSFTHTRFPASRAEVMGGR